MKDSILTIRLPSATRLAIERLARSESRSLSQATEQLIELGLAAVRVKPASTGHAGGAAGHSAHATGEPGASWNTDRGTPGRTLAGSLAGGLVPTLDDFRDVRAALRLALDRRTRARAKPRR